MNMQRYYNRPSTLLVLVVCLAVASSAAGQGIGLNALGGSLGWVNAAEGVNGGASGGAIALGIHAELGTVANMFQLCPGITYWSYGQDNGGKAREIGLSCDAHYYFNPEANLRFYGGGGLVLSMFRWSYTSSYRGVLLPYSNYAAYSKSSIGLRMLGGIEGSLNERTLMFGQLMFKMDGTVNTFTIRGGATFAMGR